MANRVYDEDTLRQAAALAKAAAQLQTQEQFQLMPALSQAALLRAQSSQLGLPSSLPGSFSTSQQRPDAKPQQEQPSSSSSAPPTAAQTAPLTKQERITETFRRGCLRLQALQESEAGDLFAKKSRWKTLKRAVWSGEVQLGRWISLWRTSIQTVEGKHGSAVSLTLYFLRFALGVNAVLTALWLAATVVPFVISPPATFSWAYFTDYPATALLQGYGLHNTFLLYGGYNYGSLYGGYRQFRLDIAFPLGIVAMFFFSLIALLWTIQQRLQARPLRDSAFVGQNQQYPFSTVVFTSWDCHLTDAKAARNLRNTIRNQLSEMLFDAALADAYVSRSQRIGSIIFKGIGLLIVWPAMVGGTALATYLIVTNQDAIAARTGFGLAATLLLSGVSIVSSMLVHFSVVAEGWHPRLRINVEALKLLSIKLINTATFVYQLYRIQTGQAGGSGAAPQDTSTLQSCAASLGLGHVLADASCVHGYICCDAACTAAHGHADYQGLCVPACAEDVIGMTFYRLMLTNMAAFNAVDILMALGYRLLGMANPFDPPSVAIAIINQQALVWLGSLYAPLLPLFSAASNALTFYVKLLLSLHLYTPPAQRASASRTNVVMYSLMLVVLVACSVPLVFNLQYTRSGCGPNVGASMASALGAAVQRGPAVVDTILTWAVSPFVLGGLAIILAFLLSLSQGQRAGYKRDREKVRAEFEAFRHEMKAKGKTVASVQRAEKGKGKAASVQVHVSSAGDHAKRHFDPEHAVSRLASKTS